MKQPLLVEKRKSRLAVKQTEAKASRRSPIESLNPVIPTELDSFLPAGFAYFDQWIQMSSMLKSMIEPRESTEDKMNRFNRFGSKQTAIPIRRSNSSEVAFVSQSASERWSGWPVKSGQWSSQGDKSTAAAASVVVTGFEDNGHSSNQRSRDCGRAGAAGALFSLQEQLSHSYPKYYHYYHYYRLLLHYFQQQQQQQQQPVAAPQPN